MSWTFKKFDVLSEDKFLLWEKLLEARTGIQFVSQQKVLLQTQVAIRMRELSITSYDEYYEKVKGNEGDGIVEWQVLVDRLVVKETTFFRHRVSMEYVRQFLKNKINQKTLGASFDVLSVGCSTGEEPYGLAMIANDCLQQSERHFYYGVTAIDVSLPALSIARKGIYSQRSLSFLTEAERENYFRVDEHNKYQVLPRLQKRVCFSQVNILDLNFSVIDKADVVFCQNVLIYFRRWRRREILNQLVSYLKSGGLLVIGLGETTDWQHPEMQRVANDEVQAYVKV